MSTTMVELSPVATAPCAISPPAPARTHSPDPRRVSASSDPEHDRAVPISELPIRDAISKAQAVAIIICLSAAAGLGSFLNGALSVALPRVARDIGLDETVLLWPQSLFSLTCGCTLLLNGALGDLFGARNLCVLGTFLQAAFNVACGLSQDGTQLIAFRGCAGVAMSMCLPSAVSIITHSFVPGPRRNVAFAALGGGQTVGFSIGLTMGGVFADTIGWRWSFHVGAVLSFAVFLVALWALPRPLNLNRVTWGRLVSEVDWVGALLASSILSMVSYVLAAITGDSSRIARPVNIALLALSGVAVAAFITWVGRRERQGKPAIIPNSFWKNRIFTCVCLNVFLVLGACNATETLASFYYQYVQGLSGLQTSLRMVPTPIGGALTNLLMAVAVHRFRADAASLTSVGISAVSPLLLAVADPAWSYWAACFPAMLVNSIGVNTLYTISNLIITSMFPPRTQGVAGGVYNTIAQIGRSFGLTTAALIAGATTAKLEQSPDEGDGVDEPTALLIGYRAAFWFALAVNGVVLVLVVWGLRKVGKVGKKTE